MTGVNEECLRVTKKEVRTKVRTIEKKIRTIEKTVREIEKTVREIEKAVCGTENKELELRASTVPSTEIDTVNRNEIPLTFSSKSSNNKCNKRTKTNSQGHQKSKKGIQTKSSGAKIEKTKGYKRPQAEKILDQKQASYKPWTASEKQKERFAQLIEESLLV